MFYIVFYDFYTVSGNPEKRAISGRGFRRGQIAIFKNAGFFSGVKSRIFCQKNSGISPGPPGPGPRPGPVPTLDSTRFELDSRVWSTRESNSGVLADSRVRVNSGVDKNNLYIFTHARHENILLCVITRSQTNGAEIFHQNNVLS